MLSALASARAPGRLGMPDGGVGVGQRLRHLPAHRREQRGREMDVGEQRVVVARLLQRALRHARGAVVGHDPREPVEYLRPRRAAVDARQRLLEQVAAARAVLHDDDRLRRGDEPPDLAVHVVLRRQLGRALGQLRRGHRRAAARGLDRGRFERRGDLLVRPFRGGGEVASALLAARRRPGQPGVERPPLRRRGALLHDRRDQRVGEAQPAAVADEDVGDERRLEARGRLGLHRRRASGRRAPRPRAAAPGCRAAAPRAGGRAAAARRSPAPPPARGSAPAPSAGCRGTTRAGARAPAAAAARRSAHGRAGRARGAQRRDGQLERRAGRAAASRAPRRPRRCAPWRAPARGRASSRRSTNPRTAARGRVEPLPVVDREQHVARQRRRAARGTRSRPGAGRRDRRRPRAAARRRAPAAAARELRSPSIAGRSRSSSAA